MGRRNSQTAARPGCARRERVGELAGHAFGLERLGAGDAVGVLDEGTGPAGGELRDGDRPVGIIERSAAFGVEDRVGLMLSAVAGVADGVLAAQDDD
jgi:hypothetical protein